VRDGLEGIGMKPVVKTTGSSGMHVYVAIVRGPLQKQVWTFAKAFAQALEKAYPDIATAEYKIANRPAGRVLVDYNQNRWGATLASVYSVRAKPLATVSTPVTWDEVEAGIELEDFRLDNVRERFDAVGDLWAPMNAKVGRFDLAPFLEAPAKPRKKKT
jgi:bifunctional non-homologous end joining protein LigD